jgi:transglutaminase-like putative cysteine protease
MGRPIAYHVASPTQKPVHHIAARITYTATLIKRRLVAGAPLVSVSPLADRDIKLFTSPTATLDFDRAAFKGWLASKGLARKTGENDILFARRVFDLIRVNYRYVLVEDQDRRATQIAATNWSDCGGLCGLFVASLRANGIPARMLIGWTAKPGSPRGHPHVRSEFFAMGVGWIPVEMSAAVYAKSKPTSLSFGYDAGDFITLHIDPDMVVDMKGPSGTINCPGLQTPAHSFEGDGTLDDASESITWVVRKLR